MIRKYFDNDLTSYPESLQGYLLVSETFIFNLELIQSVILILEHKKDIGAIGVIINKKSHLELEQFIYKSHSSSLIVGSGGFIGSHNLLYLHSKLPKKLAQSIAPRSITKGLDFNHYSKEKHEAFSNLLQLEQRNKVQLRLFSGYISWLPSQLENEINKGVWMLLPASKDIVFNVNIEKMWEHCLKEKGGLYEKFIDYGKDPMLN